MKHRRVLSAGEILGPSSEFVALQGDGVSKGYKGEPEPKSGWAVILIFHAHPI